MPVRLKEQFASLGAFQGDLIVDVEPDPNELANAYLRVAEELDNTVVPLEASKIVAREDMKAHFDEERAPDGREWKELDELTIKKKQSAGYPLDILRRTGAMEDAATSEAAWDIKGDTLFFDTGILPGGKYDGRPYWYFHQVGASSTTTYEFGGESVSQEWELEARPFIGLSDDARLKVIEIFDAWFDESIMTFQRSSGHIQTRVGGQFGPTVGT